MEDSLEDFIKITRNTKEGQKNTKENKEVRNEVLITLQKKKECEARAVKIVEFLIEGKLRAEVFLRCLKHINQAFYQDVVEERAISKLCGYSLCGKQIPEMPKKQYFINTKNNKVYDVTDRKNYCSNFCYKASLHIKKQIDDSPLWMRKFDESPKFNLLSSTERGLPGEEIDQGIVKPVNDAATATDFTSVSSFTEISLNEVDEMEIKNKAKKPTKKLVKNPEIMQTLLEDEETTNLDNPSSNPVSGIEFTKNIKQPNPLPVSNETAVKNVVKEDTNNEVVPIKIMQTLPEHEELTENVTQPNSPSISDQTLVKNVAKEDSNPKNKIIKPKISSKTSKPKKKNDSPDNVLQNIKKYVHEWITLETYVFLYGESKLKEILNEKQLEEYFKTIKIAESTAAQQRKYLDICRKLHLNQLAEDKFDRTVIGLKFKPVPDYIKLKEESKTMNLKVRSFYSGVSYESETKNENNIKEKEINVTTNENDTPPEVMPLTDNSSQTIIRRKVYLNSISKTVANLIPTLGIHSHFIMDDLQALVKTFKLQAHNVVFAPAIRTLIALILIKILSIRDHNLKTQLETKQAETFIKLMLSHFPNGHIFLLDLFENIQDVSLFLKQYFTENET